MAEMLKLPDQEFKTTFIHILRVQMDQADSTQEQMGNVNSEMDILRMKKF